MKFSREPNLKREPKLTEQVASFLASEIRQGTIQPGESLPSEAELSYRFNVSRTVIREALAQLKYEGILESKQGRRTKVAAGPKRAFRLKTSQPVKFAQLYELKALIEGDATALASVRRSQHDIKKLESCLKTLTKSMEEGIDGTSANFDFHQLITKASGNRYISEFIRYLDEILWDLIQGDEGQSSNLPLTPISLKEHVAIFNAIVKKNPNQAREAVHNHLKNSARRRGISIFKHMP